MAGDTVSLTGCSGEYYSGNAPTSAVSPDDKWYEIRLTPTLSGADAGNYQMETKTNNGKILPANGLVTASFSDGSWSSWGKTWGDYQTLTMPDGMKPLRIHPAREPSTDLATMEKFGGIPQTIQRT